MPQAVHVSEVCGCLSERPPQEAKGRARTLARGELTRLARVWKQVLLFRGILMGTTEL